MLYFLLDSENIALGLPKGQTSSNRGAQSLWVPTEVEDSRVAEETDEKFNPKGLPLGFLFESEAKKMRLPRIYKEETAYYTTVRASNNELLFRDDSDYAYFLEVLKTRKEKYNFKLYAYCLLPQHYHLLIEPTQTENLSKIMQAINTSYSLYFNKKHNRFGHLISGRFKGRLFNKDERLLHQSIYLHLNPLRAGLVQKSEAYKWSSYPEYIDTSNQGITEKDYILSFAGDTLPIGSRGVPEKYKQLVEELEVVRTPGVLGKGVLKKLKYKVGYGVALAGLIGVLIILPQLLMHKPKTDILSNNVNKDIMVNLPEGLAIYNIGKGQEKIQAWELWKIGPIKPGESDVVAQ